MNNNAQRQDVVNVTGNMIRGMLDDGTFTKENARFAAEVARTIVGLDSEGWES